MKAQRYKTLIEEVAKRKPKTIVEIGTWRGINAAKMINEAKKYNDKIKYYGFDLFDMPQDMKIEELHSKSNATKKEAKSNIKETGADFEIIVGNTKETLKDFQPEESIDFVFIDGGHSLDTIENDWSAMRRIIDKDTVVIFDDYYDNRVDIGAKPLVDILEEYRFGRFKVFRVERLEPLDVFKDADLEIRLAKVTYDIR